MGQTLSEPVTDKHSTTGADQRVSWAATEMQGWRISMEDAHICELDAVCAFAVFDGHGGQSAALFAGERLSSIVRSVVHFEQERYGEALREAFHTADVLLRTDPKSVASPSGCTAVFVLLTASKVICANAGDSRALISCSGSAVPLSFDHKPSNPIEYERITAAGGFVEGGRVNGNLALSRALADFEFKNQPHLSAEAQIVTCDPDIIERALENGDEFIVVACDGIWDCMTNQEVVNFVSTRIASGSTLKEIAEEMTDNCLARDSLSGIGCDNMTVIVVGLYGNAEGEEQQWRRRIMERQSLAAAKA